MRPIVAGLLVVFSLYVAISQWICICTIPRKKNAQGEPRSYSIVPLIGGGLGAIGCALSPQGSVQALWWVPLVLDPGCALLIGAVAVAGLVHLMRGFTGPRT